MSYTLCMGHRHHWWLYVLKLEEGKWYVGITSKTPEDRLHEHRLGVRAAYWTKKYHPVDIELIEDLGVVNKEHAEKYEDKITRSLMKERGINNVRGGDLRDVDQYVKRFGWFYLKDQWEILTLLVLSFLVNIYLLIDGYLLN